MKTKKIRKTAIKKVPVTEIKKAPVVADEVKKEEVVSDKKREAWGVVIDGVGFSQSAQGELEIRHPAEKVVLTHEGALILYRELSRYYQN